MILTVVCYYYLYLYIRILVFVFTNCIFTTQFLQRERVRFIYVCMYVCRFGILQKLFCFCFAYALI